MGKNIKTDCSRKGEKVIYEAENGEISNTQLML
jgi:hypothetical protein